MSNAKKAAGVLADLVTLAATYFINGVLFAAVVAVSLGALVGIGMLGALRAAERYDRLTAAATGVVTALFVGAVLVLAHDLSKSHTAQRLLRAQVSRLRKHQVRDAIVFKVYETEYEPGSSSFSKEYAYEYAEANEFGPAGGEHKDGVPVKVECELEGGQWYRLADGNFMKSSAIHLGAGSREPNPPICVVTFPRNEPG